MFAHQRVRGWNPEAHGEVAMIVLNVRLGESHANMRFIIRIGLAEVLMVGSSAISSQDYPNKPVRIVTSEIGADSDFGARLIAQGISGALGQQVIVDNRPSSLSAEIASKAQPDGYTMFVAGGALWIAPLLQKTPYDPVRDFTPITLMTRSLNVLVVSSSFPVKSVKELIALAKAKPGELNYGAGGIGGPPHLAGELFKSLAGVNILRVPYKGGGPALNGLLGGEVQLMFATASAAMQHVKSGKLRALGITSAQPSELVPGVSPIAVSLPGYDASSVTVIVAPAQTPAVIVNRLNREIVRFLKTPEAKEPFFNSGVEAVGNSPDELAALMRSDIAKWGKVIKDAGIKIE